MPTPIYLTLWVIAVVTLVIAYVRASDMEDPD
jgi:hypothetical protein